jgi:RNA-directed DNA polymerase
VRRYGGLFETVVSSANLWQAWRQFRRGKRQRPSVRHFELDADRHVLGLRRELLAGSYRPGEYRLVPIREPKHRLIAAAPVRDRVIHHGVHRVLAPLLDPGLVGSTYACLEGRGGHRAVLAFVAALRRHRYVVMLDVRHYFLSIDRAILMDLMARRIKDRRLLGLLRTIADSGDGLYRSCGVPEFLGLEPGFPPWGCGLPIGNLTSQWWGNHYLSGLDHFATRELRLPRYQRYMDDLALFSDSRAALEEARGEIGAWLGRERRLRLKHPQARVRSTRGRFTYLGYRVARAGVEPTREALRRMQRRVSELVLRGDAVSVRRSLASYRGVLTFVDTGREKER